MTCPLLQLNWWRVPYFSLSRLGSIGLTVLRAGNAIEKLWRQLKAAFRRTDPRLPWEQRLALAYEECSPQYIEKIISSTIRWCREKHLEFEAGLVAPPVGDGVMVIDAKDDEDDEVDEEDIQNALDALEEW